MLVNYYDKNSNSDVFPYLFISYSHKDEYEMNNIKRMLEDNKVRYWYDDGLHSGDDWNLIIAKYLRNAAVCLVLLSPNAAQSDYVKNELSYAIKYRIPIHVLMLQEFELPLDIDLLTVRIEIIKNQNGFENELINSLPIEIFELEQELIDLNKEINEHPLFVKNDELMFSQGTRTFLGKHCRLEYPCIIQEDLIKETEESEAQTLGIWASNLEHPLFPKIYDIEIKNNYVRVYQEYRQEIFLDEYLKMHLLTEQQIIDWMIHIIGGIEYLFCHKFALRDFASGSLVVINSNDIGIFRLHNLYYGLVPLNYETKNYYFEKELQEIAILLAQLCTGQAPLLPIRIIRENRFHQDFLDRVNLVIQKCVKVDGKAEYTSFSQIIADLRSSRIKFSDKIFLKKREKRLEKYDATRNERYMKFVSCENKEMSDIKPDVYKNQINLEEEFGFEGTSILDEVLLSSDRNSDVKIRLMVCSSGQIFEFHKNSILIGKERGKCDLVWMQPYISRKHARISKVSADQYILENLSSVNGTYVLDKNIDWISIELGHEHVISSGAIFRLAGAELKIL